MKKRICAMLLALSLIAGTTHMTAMAASTFTATPTALTGLVNDEDITFDAYNINGNNYFKLRDLAYILLGTEKQFEITWDGERNAVILTNNTAYTVVGGEMTGKGAGDKSCVPTSSKIYLDGKEARFVAYNIEGNNYFRLLDIGRAFDFYVVWDSVKDMIVIDTSKGYEEEIPEDAPMKPVIYLYPEVPTEVTVNLNYDGVLDVTYPAYHDGWNVTAYPDGTLINHRDGKEYSYLFWEGHGEADYDLSKGFVVKGEDTVEFLQEKLSYMGLLPKEYNEFIIYWLPQMQNNAYNFITFQGEAYTDTAELIINPAPDSILRVFMTFTPLDEPIEVEEQALSPFTRTGFTVIEWGGCELR